MRGVFAALVLSVCLSGPVQAITNFRIFFDFGEDRLSEDGHAVIDDLVTFFQTLEADNAPELLGVDITGHADAVEDAGPDKTLSLRRAQVVRDALIRRGIRAERIRVAGLGNRDPMQPSSGREPMNRHTLMLIKVWPWREVEWREGE